MPRNVLQTLTIVALVAAIFFVAHNFVRYVLRVDGGYSQWTVFSQCSKPCGTGTRFRTRTCNNPMPRFDGQNCSVHGEDTQTFKCNMNPCPVDGGYSPWSGFGECSVTCGNGVQKQERSCDSPAPMFGGISCDKLELGPSVETKECKKGMCPVNGGYGPWGEFGECSVTCGGGFRQKERKCNNPEPKYFGKTCEEQERGPRIQSEPCNVEPCPVNGGYGPWGEFGECSVTCGGGFRQRERKCDNPEPKYFGKTCEEQELGPSIQSEPCNVELCPVDGGYSEWTEFSACTVTCGGGVHERTRECTNPAPAYNGKNCEVLGPAMESENCNTEPCPTQPAQDHGKGNKKEQENKENEKEEDKEKGNKEGDGKESEKEGNKNGNNQENKKGDDKGQ